MAECKCNCNSASSCASNIAHGKVYACAGASNVGKMSMELAIALHQDSSYQMSCAAGVGADICGFTDGAKTENTMNLLIDGCPVGCLKQMFDSKGISNYDHIVVTELGVAKDGNFAYDPAIITDLITKIKAMGL